MAKEKKPSQYRNAKTKFKSWVDRVADGKEKKIGIIMLVIAFSTFGYQLYNRIFNPSEDRVTIGETFDKIKTPVEEDITTGPNTLLYDYNEMKKDEKALEIIEQMQFILKQKTVDTLKFRELQAQLKALNINLDN